MVKRIVPELVKLYIERHVRKSMEHDNLPHWCRRPIWDLHGRYLKSRIPVKDATVLEYFRDISPSAVNNIIKMWLKETSRAKKDTSTSTGENEESNDRTTATEDDVEKFTGVTA
jgi:hypothetical protein